MEAIVYVSKTGFTKQYADILSEKIGIQNMPYGEAKKVLEKGANIFFMGWICAGKIKKFRKIRKRFNIEGVAGIGMNMPTDKVRNCLVKDNKTSDTPLFYLQGGLNLQKLKGPYRVIINFAGKLIGRKYDGKTDDQLEEEKIMADVFKNGRSFVSEDNIKDIIDWYENIKK